MAIPLRLMRVLGELAGAARDPAHARAVLDQARRLASACAEGFPDGDRGELEARARPSSGLRRPSRGAARGRTGRTGAMRRSSKPASEGWSMALADYLLGRPLATDEEGEQRVGVWAGIPMLGLDALGSAAYGPEAALTLLIPLGAAGVGYIGPISTLIILLLLVVYVSYRQTIAAYPHGGGSYTVARENLGTTAGLLAAAALMLDYVLVVAVGISAGVGALVSAVPALQPYTLPLCLAILAMITVVNLRGVRESGLAFLVPTYLFVVSMLAVLGLGVDQGGRSPADILRRSSRPPPGAGGIGGEALDLDAGLRQRLHGDDRRRGRQQRRRRLPRADRLLRPADPDGDHRATGRDAGRDRLPLPGLRQSVRPSRGGPGYQSVLSQLVAAVVGRGAFYYSPSARSWRSWPCRPTPDSPTSRGSAG